MSYSLPVQHLAQPDESKNLAVLLACGSFNPITNMHLRIFEMGKDHLVDIGFQVLGGYLSPVSDHYGKKGLLPINHRKPMVERSIESSTWLMADSWEADQPQWTPTVQVMKHFDEQLNNQRVKDGKKKIRVMLLCGSDLLHSFNTPGLWDEEDMKAICELGIVCIEREGSLPGEIVANHPILSKYQVKYHSVGIVLKIDRITSSKLNKKFQTISALLK
eukprot:TRINITY_DN5199_c0_g1_i2.p1 TRINITY_DN5199_c0_g1~~TRINITY_DN5199_c0_g1_i2.p1  ORF type:complete len:218 (+),score=37.50 TRINITY_DN5199_c0_g1_i2:15-668(+)